MKDKKDTKPKLTLFRATMIAEGVEDPDYPQQYIEAWQYLIDTGHAWKLQGFFGRTAHRLLSEGICTPPKSEEDEREQKSEDNDE